MKKALMFAAALCAASPLSADEAQRYSDYESAMATVKGDPMAVEWQNANDAAIKEATDDDALAAAASDAAAAEALLSQVRGAYESDPVMLAKAAAVSQWVMEPDPFWLLFWKPSRSEGRKVWVQALLATAEKSQDAYVKMFCLDQLRWCGCGCPKVLARIAAIGEGGGKAVREFAAVVTREIEGRGIGL